jgi:predicted TIM-barrel fold metal-dependent hydrolase
VTGDIFYERFPAHLKDRAPRLWTDDEGRHNWYMNGESLIPPVNATAFHNFESLPGAVSMEPRLRDLALEGVEKEIAFGNAINIFLYHPDLEVREWVYRIYNHHLAEMAALAPGRFYGVGLVNYWDPAKAEATVAELTALNLRSLMIPITPKGADGTILHYADEEMEPFWTAVENSGLPVCFHAGESFQDGRGGLGTSILVNLGPFRKNFGELVFGGVFDRHPSLQIVFAEGDLNWVPGTLQMAETITDSYETLLDYKIKLRPTDYWHRNCYATFMWDPIGLQMLGQIGADRVMWSSDYPHYESTFGYGWTAIEAVLDAVSEDDARMILGGTAMELFKLD